VCPLSSITRRTFIEFVSAALCLSAGYVITTTSQVQVILRKVRARFKTSPSPSKQTTLHIAELPRDGENVSLELALNSRCCSDDDGDPEIFHWGMFDTSSTVSVDQINRIANLARKVALPEGSSKVEVEEDRLAFSINAASANHARTISMIENGMQQQSVCLVCAALGMGLTFDSRGPDGQQLSPERHLTTKMCIRPMRASYNGSYWTDLAPEKERPWLPGNLPNPRRDGETPLVKAIANLRWEGDGSELAAAKHVSQLLWAARGRTPHLYKSKPWGLTIPTWQGLQNISSTYIAMAGKLYRYINWKDGRPTHGLVVVENQAKLGMELQDSLAPANCLLVLVTNETYARALWEVGYQLLNVMLQASALGIWYRATILTDQGRNSLGRISNGTPVALVGFRGTDGLAFRNT
jgi:hypothetical protein